MIRLLWYIFSLLISASLYAQDELAFYNTSTIPVYGVLCYRNKQNEQLIPASDMIVFAPCSLQVVARPPRQYHWYGLYDRLLAIADTREKLEPLSVRDDLTLVSIGSLQGSDFFLDNRHGTLQGYNALSWNIRMLHEALEAAFCFMMQEIRDQHSEHQYNNVQAKIRTDTGVCPEESAYLAQRDCLTRKAGVKFGLPDAKVWPRIALCASGGGYRAMISTLGWLQGAEKIGLLDAATYVAGVSGSTWAIAGFIESDSSIAHYLKICLDHIEKSFLYDHDSDQVADALMKQFVFTQNVSLIDFYGALLAQKILKPYVPNPHDIDLASQAEKIAGGKQIFPIYTAVLDVDRGPYEWVEFTPYEVANNFLGAAIPTWAFGRTFCGGLSTNFSPSQSLGFYMGIWGSALSANLKDLVHRYAQRLGPDLIARLLQNLVQSLSLAEGRITAAQVPNWTVGTQLPYAHQATLQLLDAGLDGNLPLPPLLNPERNIDIIIVLDATYLGDNGAELVRAQIYAERHELPFPPIDYSQISMPCSVHADWGNPDVPVILYIPLRKLASYQQGWDPYQQNFISTFNFKYTKEQMLLLSGLTEHSIMLSQPVIFDTIQRVIARKLQLQVD